ncbi:MAG TPA: phage holin family protein [Longilinea sp.]|nr:phage holin family protein [Longilinea sp.]
MRKFVLRLIINAVALYVAIALMRNNGITPTGQNWYDYLWLALIFGVINAVIKPILVVASCPLLILTLGLGTLLINTLLFYLAGWIGTQFGVGFTVDGFVPAFLGALIVSVISFILSQIFRDEMR